ncbi:TolC family protein [Aquipluma nitroreducens]|uniref:TolC family protein n=1 Tax=Aquipluma nitroreducens TaxID=2010828 RepID=UPI00296FA0EC|nr:TolC family protein [Aquipluma nitroreducens]
MKKQILNNNLPLNPLKGTLATHKCLRRSHQKPLQGFGVKDSTLNRLHYLFLIIFFSGFIQIANAQSEKLSLSLDEVVRIASKSSLDAFRYKNMYLSSYWEYRYYKADKLPSLSMSATPLDFNHYRKREYNFQTNEDQYVLRDYINSDVALKLNQNIGLTGGSLFLSSELGMVKNMGGDQVTSYQATPVSIGYSQSLNGYNALRWQSKIEPVKYDKAKKTFIQSQETLAMKSTAMFFDLVEAQIQLKIAQNNMSNADTLYKIGKGRFQVGTVTQDELLNLELNQLNSQQALNSAKLEVTRAQSGLNSYLMMDKKSQIDCKVPSEIPTLQIMADHALDLALKNNPEILDQQQQMLEQDQQVAQARSESGLNTTVFAMYGLNQSAENFDRVYDQPDQSQRVQVGFNIPLVDWGRRKGKLMMAESTREVANARIKQSRIDFEQNIFQSVMEFNLQAEQVRNAAKADTVAQKGYDVTFQRFLIGKVDVTKLNIARTDRESARKAYISAVKTYWSYYYQLRMLTLFDFIKNEDLTAEYDKIIQN